MAVCFDILPVDVPVHVIQQAFRKSECFGTDLRSCTYIHRSEVQVFGCKVLSLDLGDRVLEMQPSRPYLVEIVNSISPHPLNQAF